MGERGEQAINGQQCGMEATVFKVGDKVKVVKVRPGLGAEIGATATVHKVGTDILGIIWDKNELSTRAVNGDFYADQFELVAPKIDYMELTREFIRGSR